MKRTFLQVQAQIEKLQREAEALRQKEVNGVIARIREAVNFYKLTAADIFGPTNGADRPATKRRTAAGRKAAPNQAVQPKRGSRKGSKVPIKYRDADGNEWSGRGSKPRWLVSALNEGKSLESFLVK